MALTDSLRILITANGAQAARELEKVGRAATTNMGKAETGAQRFGRNLTSAGLAIGTFAGVALVGLNKAAQAADEENRAILRLQNSISNSPALVGAQTDAFIAQASALQDSTRFADDATISAQAMLATFRLTQDQILQLTPLVQDVSAKFGVDLERAAVQVGKAMQGSIGGLQRWGVIIDEDAYAADRFSAVVSALRENAGGFAEQEGQTFSGQLEILKHNIDDLVESAGRVATPALVEIAGNLTTAAEAAGNLGETFEDLSEAVPGIGDVAGAMGDLVGFLNPLAQMGQVVESFKNGFTSGDILGDGEIFGDAIMSSQNLVTALGNTQAVIAAGEDAMDGLERSTEGAADAASRLSGEWGGLENRLGDFSATLSAQEAVFSFRDALREARDGAHISAREMNGLNQEMIRLIQSHVAAAEANNTAASGAVNFRGRNQELRASLGALAAFIPSALRPQFNALTQDILRVPTSHNTTMHMSGTADVSQALSALDSLRARISVVASAYVNIANAAAQAAAAAPSPPSGGNGGNSRIAAPRPRSRRKDRTPMPVFVINNG